MKSKIYSVIQFWAFFLKPFFVNLAVIREVLNPIHFSNTIVTVLAITDIGANHNLEILMETTEIQQQPTESLSTSQTFCSKPV